MQQQAPEGHAPDDMDQGRQNTGEDTQRLTEMVMGVVGQALEQQWNHIHALFPQIQTNTSHAPEEERRRRIKLEPPAKFNGKEFTEWYRQMETYLRVYKEDFKTDQEKSLFILSKLEGGAPGAYATNIWKRHEGKDLPKPTDLLNEINSLFKDKNEETNAQIKLNSLKQSDFRTLEEFFQHFEIYFQTCGYDKHHKYLIELMQRAVKPEIVRGVFMRGGAITYEDWKEKALAWYTMEEQLKLIEKGSKYSSQRVFNNSGGGQGVVEKKDRTGVTFGGSGQPMDLDKAKSLGLCFHCGQKGHLARYCPKKQTQIRQLTEETEEKREMPKQDDPMTIILRQLTLLTENMKSMNDRLQKTEDFLQSQQ